MSEAEKFLRDKSIGFYVDNPFYHIGIAVKFKDVIEVMEQYHQSKVNNVVLDDVSNGFYCHDELVNNMLNHNGGKCKEQCKSCINDMQEK